MLSYYISSLLTTICSLVLGLFIFIKNPKSPLHNSILRLNSAVALWSFFLFIHYLSRNPEDALLTARLLHIGAVFIPSCYLHFVAILVGINIKNIIRFSYLLSLLFLAAVFSPDFVSSVEPKMFFRFYATAGRLYLFWILSYVAISGYGSYLLLKNYRIVPLRSRIQRNYILCASVIGFIGGATIFPLFYNIPIAPFGEYLIFLYPLIFTIAILKHNLLDINIVIKRTIVYSVSVALITMAYLIIVLLSEIYLRNVIGYRSLLVTVTAAVCIALLFTPIKNRVQSMADRFFVGSEYQRLKNELIESDKRKAVADLAAGMAHEIRNPLTAIRTFAEYLPKKFDDAEFRNNFSRIVTKEVDRVNLLIAELLEFAKPQALSFAPANIHELIDYTLDLLSSEAIKSNIEIIRDYNAQNPITNIDASKFKHVLLNIIKNAVEAIKDSGEIKVSTYSDGNGITIEVSDTGAGIRPRELDRIFEPFFSSKEKGAGLGLAVTKSIIAEHKGTISVRNNPDSGATFSIALPN